MTLDEYQSKALKTALPFVRQSIVYTALGLAGEAGEVVERIKKACRKQETLMGANFTIDEGRELAGELGDILWYVALMADQLGYPLDLVAVLNILKLTRRQATGQIKERA